MKFRIAPVVMIAVAIASLASCSMDKRLQQEEEDQIRNFIALNNITAPPKASGLYYIETQTGTGNFALQTDTVGVYYKMKLLTGVTLEDRTSGDAYQFPLGTTELIAGFTEGVSYMKVGGKANIVVPSSLAWGKYGFGYYIGPYTPVYFELELRYIIPGPGK